MSADVPSSPLTPAQARALLRRSLEYVTLAWVFGSIWMHITTGAAMTRYAQGVGMGQMGFGILAALPFAAGLLQLPASLYLERGGGRKSLFLICGLLHRALWLLIALIPWIVPQVSQWWCLVALLALSAGLANLSLPAWITWMGDLIPGKLRGRYLARREGLGRMMALVTTLLMGWAMDRTGGDLKDLEHLISLALAVAALFGIADILFFLPVPEPKIHGHAPAPTLRELIGQPLGDPNFRRFLAFNGMLTFAVGYIGQFIWLYLFDVVGMSNTRANFMLVAVPLLVSALSLPIWGRLVDRLGCRPVLLIAGIMIVHGGASWIFVTRESWWMGYLAAMSAAAAWPGVEIASLTLLMGMSGPGAEKRRVSAYVAVNSVVVAVAGLASGLFGGVVAQTLKDWHGSLMGWPLTYHGLLFLISAGLRLVSLIWLLGLREPASAPPLTALRYVVTTFYSNIQQAVFLPVRGLRRLGRITYKMLPKSKGPEK